MAQGSKKTFNKKGTQTKMQKRKAQPVLEKEKEKHETVRHMKKQIQQDQKKVYRSIENLIIAKAKSKRTHFELI